MIPKIRLRRHEDDEYWDEISIHAPVVNAPNSTGAGLGISIIPRFKTSDLSGNEWRYATHFTLNDRGGTNFERRFHTVNDALKYGPYFVWTKGRALLAAPNAAVTVLRKGYTLWAKTFPTFADAAFGLYWHLVIASESDQSWRQLTDVEERAHCQQPGCADKPSCLYMLKQKRVSKGGDMRAFQYDWEARHRWFCTRHAHRGDCGLEDADVNYEVVEGVPPEKAGVFARDESPSAFGGVVGFKEEK